MFGESLRPTQSVASFQHQAMTRAHRFGIPGTIINPIPVRERATPDPDPSVTPTATPTPVSAWTDIRISGTHANYTASTVSCGDQVPITLDRVRFTKVYTVVFYANLQGEYGAQNAPSCPALPAAGSAVWGILPSIPLQDSVPGGDCSNTWVPGGGVYSREIDPNPASTP